MGRRYELIVGLPELFQDKTQEALVLLRVRSLLLGQPHPALMLDMVRCGSRGHQL